MRAAQLRTDIRLLSSLILGPRPLRSMELLRIAAGSCSSQERRAVAMPGTGLGDRSLGACSDDRRIRKHQKGQLQALLEAL